MMIKKKIIFKILLFCIPFVFFIFLEFILRLFNLFEPVSLFINDKKGLIQVNSNIGERYFDKNKVPVPNMYPQSFLAQKNKDTFRIFCLGGSTTGGFPYEMNIPFPQQLKFILENQISDIEFEMINLGLSAINSFSVLDWIPEILNHDPDLIIIYMGHNEFYGAYGAGSAISFSNNGSLIRILLKIKKLHFVKMIEMFLTKKFVKKNKILNTTLMEQISNKKNIPVKSKIREIVKNNYENNLDIILKLITQENIPVIISNLTSNLKDQVPFGGGGRLNQNTLSSIEYYNKGLDLYKNKKPDSSKVAFQLALDLDEIPFRAPSNINSIISKKAIAHGINLLDMENIFEKKSKNLIPGDNLFSDHLHPNPKGYFLMGVSFYNKIVETGLFNNKNLKKLDISELFPLYVTSLDWEIGRQRLFRLKNRWPFNKEENQDIEYIPYDSKITAKIANDFVFKHHIWGKAHEDIARYYEEEKDFYKASLEYELITKFYPDKIKYFYKLIENSKKASRWRVVERACKILKNIENKNPIILYDLAIAQRALGKLEDSFKNVNQSISGNLLNNKQLAYAKYLKALILIDIKEYSDAAKILNSIKVDYPEFKPVNKIIKNLQLP